MTLIGDPRIDQDRAKEEDQDLVKEEEGSMIDINKPFFNFKCL